MKYVSTRNNQKEFNFKEVFIKGLADDGGLFVPKSLKKFTEEEINNLSNLNYRELAIKIMFPFCSDFIDEIELKNIIEKFNTIDICIVLKSDSLKKRYVNFHKKKETNSKIIFLKKEKKTSKNK